MLYLFKYINWKLHLSENHIFLKVSFFISEVPFFVINTSLVHISTHTIYGGKATILLLCFLISQLTLPEQRLVGMLQKKILLKISLQLNRSRRSKDEHTKLYIGILKVFFFNLFFLYIGYIITALYTDSTFNVK